MANIPVRVKPATTFGISSLISPYDPQISSHEQNAVLSGDYFSNDGSTLLWARNPTGGDITVAFTIEGMCENGVSHAFGMTVPAGSRGFIGPFLHPRFSEDDGRVAIVASSTSLMVAAVRF